MSRNNLDKMLKRIEKSEEKSLKILFRQRKDLLKALEDNERLIQTKIQRGASQQEIKMEQEIEKLTRRLEYLKTEMEEVRQRREGQVRPMRQRSEELREKLKLVDSQIDSTHEMRERRQSRVDLEELADAASRHPPRRQISAPDFSPSSPPPYSPYWPTTPTGETAPEQ